MFSNRLKDLREDCDLTQDQLADKLNITRSAIAKYETGVREPSIELLILIANFFNVTLDYLTGRTNKKVSYSDIKKLIDRLP